MPKAQIHSTLNTKKIYKLNFYNLNCAVYQCTQISGSLGLPLNYTESIKLRARFPVTDSKWEKKKKKKEFE